MGSLSILRFLTDNVDSMPLGIMSALLESFDVIQLLVSIIEVKPWLYKNSQGLVYVWNDGVWGANTGSDSSMCKPEAQAWLALYNTLFDPTFRSKYHFTTSKKAAIMRCQRHITEVLIDQIPLLSELRRFLDELALFDPPVTAPAASLIMVHQECTLKKSFITNVDWDALRRHTLSNMFTITLEEKSRHIDSLASVFTSTQFEDLSRKGTKTCALCGSAASKRCSRCKNEWYCSRDCQANHWPTHKPLCDIVAADLATKS
ncbi:zinc finger MYND domain protein [Pelomyxa schiedti]|nr:zinc finger MYND domain protein [Pelomyxa schiedti]